MGRPSPPWNDEQLHRYFTTVYALDVDTVGLKPGYTLEEFRAAMHGHILDEGQIVPSYTLKPGAALVALTQ